MKLYSFHLDGFGKVISSVTLEHLLNCINQQPDLEFLESTTLKFSESRSLTIPHREQIDSPSKELCTDIMNCVFEHFCSGTFHWFVDLCLLLENSSLNGTVVLLEKDEVLQLLALIATLHDENSTPVLLYRAELLV